MLLTACEFHASENGNLDGFWQVSAIETLTTGQTADMRESQMSWGVQGNLLVVYYDKAVKNREVLFRFRHENNMLTLFSPYISNRDLGDIAITDAMELEELGIYNLEETFKVLQLDGSSMVLESGHVRLYFRRY